MTRLLALMGSGETTPTMVETHKRLLAAAGSDAPAVVIDTPYGFQRNADEITARTVAYFHRNVGRDVAPVELRDVDSLSPAALEHAVAAVEEAAWVFAGPGSPTYLRRQWSATRLPEVLRARLHRPGVSVFASAAVCSVGCRTLPVYEIYKVGEPLHWQDGFDLTAELGLRCVVIPHFDNAEGGTHDTRYCYLGEERLVRLEAELPDDVWVLGIDEHTAAVIDLDAGTVRVEGRGALTVRDRGRHEVIPAGATVSLEELAALARGVPGHAAPPPPPADSAVATTDPPAGTDSPLLTEVAAQEDQAQRALAAGDALGAADATLALAGTLRAWSADTTQSADTTAAESALDRAVVRLARLAQRGLAPRRDLVAPIVEAVLVLRADARARGDYAVADALRDGLMAAGVMVQDAPEGVTWDLVDDGE
jgi:cyanophycinase-like exopeptidase